MRLGRPGILMLLVAWMFGSWALTAPRGPQSAPSQRQRAQDAYKNRNYRDAYEIYRRLTLAADADPLAVGVDLSVATQCLQQLNRTNEIDAYREAVIDAHGDHWRLLQAAAWNYLTLPHQGFIIAGEFQRGNHRGGGRVVNATERDRVRAMQLMAQAMPLALADDDRSGAAEFLLTFSRILLNNRGYAEAWRLQYLTDLKTLPDYDQGWGYAGGTAGAPVDDEGNPVYHRLPRTFDQARTDGQRWRWCLAQAMEIDPRRKSEIQMERARFLLNQFGVQTMARFGIPFGRMQVDDTKEDQSGTFALHTLSESETIARLATGIKRFTLPDEFNYIKIFQEVASEGPAPLASQACQQLAQIFENRRQYPQAAEAWRRCLKEHGSRNKNQRQQWKDRLAQIVDDWGRFEPMVTQPAGRGAEVEFRFRNAKEVHFTASRIKVATLLDDVMAYLKSRPGRLDGNRINIGNLGYRLVHRDEKKYLGEEVASWTLALDPRPKHFDRRITVDTPLSGPGAYLLTAKISGGNTSHIVVWLADTAIVKKRLDNRTYYYVADAVTGRPVAKAHVEFFGFRQEHRGNRRFDVLTKQFAEYADADGQVIVSPAQQPNNYQWIVLARTQKGRFAYLGFTGVWYGQRYDAQYNQTKVFTITDRPVYRPGQKVHYKFWLRQAKYDKPSVSNFAGQAVTIEIYNAKNERVERKPVKLDEYGGVEGELTLPDDAGLGVWRLLVEHRGGSTFRVEEYKKPEFEVTVDAPSEPVMLGETIEATIKAKYYFGSPVTHAKVKYKVTRVAHSQGWYPPRPWDWFYGPGYWWFGYDYDWYPGFSRWGCRAPMPFWWPRRAAPPEVVAEREVEIGPHGTVKVQIDTAPAKAIHPDQDQQYTITAEVVDKSRRTIVGSGNVLVARKPFTVYAWVDRGYYRAGETIRADFAARRLDGKPVQGSGKVEVLEIRYRHGQPEETVVHSAELATDEQGRAQLQLEAARPGQYRISYKLTDAAEHTIEGGYVFTVTGRGFDGADFRFNHLELVPDKAEYGPGETVKLMINTDRLRGTVLLFVRPTNGVYLPPRIVHLEGKSTVEEIAVTQKDMPNFFVEAITLADGRLHTATKEIVVPPAKRVLGVEVLPSAEQYKPGQKATVKLKLTNFAGKPFLGSTVVAIYDKSVEYISGGSNVPEIKAFFWKWRRQHQPQTESSLGRRTGNLVPPGAKGMGNVGIFGATSVDDLDATERSEEKNRVAYRARDGGMMGGAFGGGGFGGAMAPGAKARRMTLGAPMKLAEVEMAMDRAAPMAAAAKADVRANGGAGAAMVQPTVRSKFADTALWVGSLKTGKDGTAEVSLTMPENLTTWRIKVWAMGHGTRVGQGSADVVTRKNLVLRLQAPRFFVEKDEVVLSANVHNYLKTAKQVRVRLELKGDTIDPLGPREQTVKIAAGDEARVDWRVKVVAEGQAVVRMLALTDEESDAMEMRFPCYVHGMLKTESVSGAIRPDEKGGQFTVRVPAQRRPEATRLELRYSPTLAGAMVDALPYLADYPYGCTEQTLNRFLPTVITQKVLIEMGLDLEAIRKKRVNLNAQEIGDAATRAKQWKRFDRNPVFDQDEVRRMVKAGVNKLVAMQLSDGGWGWFSGYGERSTPHTTAVVVHGLQLAVANDVALPAGVLERGTAWLQRYQNRQVTMLENALRKPKTKPWKSQAGNLDALVYMVLVDAGVKNDKMRDFLYRDRPHLAVYSLAVFGIALQQQGQDEMLAMVMRNIGQYLVEDEENQTAWLNLPGGYWWCWYGSEFEAHAYYLKLLARTDPKGRTASRLVKYLLNNRKHATYWNSTRDTALCIEAMADYLKASGEDRPEMTVEIRLDGKLQKAVEITPANLFTFDNKLVVEGKALGDGPHRIEISKRGRGPLYYNAYLTNFTLEDYIRRAGLEIKVNRKYYRLKRVEASVKAAGSRGQPVDQKIEKYRREELPDLAMLTSGDLVEVELEIESKNDYEYLVFEDMKPAGFEPVDLRSGYTGNDLGAYVEFRDNRVVFFVRRLARGRHSVAYRMRAEIPGRFSALPTRASAMYAPELKANSDEIKLRVQDAE